MSDQKQASHDEDKKMAARVAAEDKPEFRSVPLMMPSAANPMVDMSHTTRSVGFASPMMSNPKHDTGVIDKSAYFRTESNTANAHDSKKPPVAKSETAGSASIWIPRKLRPVPAFYPLEKSTRLVEFETPESIASRLSERLRTLSVYAVYDDRTATASLLTAENVEMFLSLWHTPSHSAHQGVLVEVQRRKGDSIAFHRYCRAILDAAVEGIPEDLQHSNPDWYEDITYSKKVERMLNLELKNHQNQEHENAIVAIEIAHSLLKKDRMDARQLGLESLCLLTDPTKTGFLTATLAAHVVLLGTTQGVEIPGVDEEDLGLMTNEEPFEQIRESVLGLVQFSRIGEDDVMDGTNPMDQESIDKEHMTLLHNLALAVLANSLDVIEQSEHFEEEDTEPEESQPRGRLRTASSNDVTEEFMAHTKDMSKKEILSTLISELGSAKQQPHNATLSAKCIGSLCRASEKAKRRAKELGAKEVVSTALEVGERTHLKLETECKKVVTALETPTTRQEQQDEEEL